MATIFEKSPGDLIASSGRQFITFQSGLIRVDQKFTCRNDLAEFWRAQLAQGQKFPGIPERFFLPPDQPSTGGAVDDYYIYPEPQYVTGKDGLTEFTVSGYSRTLNGRNGVSWRVSGGSAVFAGVVISSGEIFGTVRNFGHWSEYENEIEDTPPE